MQHLVPLRRKGVPVSGERITSLHGAGGELMGELLTKIVLPRFVNRSSGRIGLAALETEG